jgi:hypothetical protein
MPGSYRTSYDAMYYDDAQRETASGTFTLTFNGHTAISIAENGSAANRRIRPCRPHRRRVRQRCRHRPYSVGFMGSLAGASRHQIGDSAPNEKVDRSGLDSLQPNLISFRHRAEGSKCAGSRQRQTAATFGCRAFPSLRPCSNSIVDTSGARANNRSSQPFARILKAHGRRVGPDHVYAAGFPGGR